MCKTRIFGFSPVGVGAPVKDFEKPVIPAKFMLTPSRSPMALEIIISTGNCDRGFLNIACLGPLDCLRDLAKEVQRPRWENTHLGDVKSINTVFFFSAGGKYLNRSH